VQRRRLLAWAIATGLLTPGRALTAPPASVGVEVEFLLASIQGSGCLFFRNGTGYDGMRAAAHLRDKFDVLMLRGQIARTEDFIERAATRSSLSGLPYAVQCAGSESVTSERWLRDRLARHRAGDG